MRFFTDNGNEYKTILRGMFSRIYLVNRSAGYRLEFVSSVSRGIYGDRDLAAAPNPDAHEQIRSAIEFHAGSPITRELIA